MNNEEIVFEVLSLIEKSRAKAGEVYLIDSQGTKINVLKGEIENLEFSEEKGIGVRVLQKNKIGFSFTSDLQKEGLKRVVREALDNSAHTFQDLANGFPGPAGELSSVQCYDSSQEKVAIKEKIAIAQIIEKSALEYDPRITAFYGTFYQDEIGRVFIANTQGLNYSFLLSGCIGATAPVAKDESGSQFGDESDFALSIFGLLPKEIGARAAQKAIAKLGAKPYSTGRVDLVLDPEITAHLFSRFLPALYADNILKGKSLFKEKLGQKIASDKVTLIDDGRLKGRAGTRPIDGEGITTRETVLIDRGRLVSWLHSLYTSRKMNVEPTGNVRRSSYVSPPTIGPTNLYLKPCSISKEGLISEVRDGLYINSVMGHNISPISGEFSLGASGRVIEKGELTYPVERIAIAGNMIDLLNSVAEVANDLRFCIDGIGGCTILLEGISVSGK